MPSRPTLESYSCDSTISQIKVLTPEKKASKKAPTVSERPYTLATTTSTTKLIKIFPYTIVQPGPPHSIFESSSVYTS